MSEIIFKTQKKKRLELRNIRPAFKTISIRSAPPPPRFENRNFYVINLDHTVDQWRI